MLRNSVISLPSKNDVGIFLEPLVACSYWAIALPSYGLSLLLYLIALYNAWNMVCTNPFQSYYTFRGSILSGGPAQLN
jgi:hypothetical protein